MPYQAEISRSNPTCFLFLVDHSTSMNEPVMGTEGNPKKSEFVAEALNRVLQSLVVSASKDLDIRQYYQVGVIGYGSEIQSILPVPMRKPIWPGSMRSTSIRCGSKIEFARNLMGRVALLK